MRITYLVYENGQDGGKLRIATKEEWSRIMDENRGLPCDKRRYFIEDTIDDFGEMDRMYIESSKQEYLQSAFWMITGEVTSSVKLYMISLAKTS